MDWHAWLSSARLEPALVHEYALVLARNELEAGDVVYFDHEFLHSMGISVAKHRLEILKLARGSRAHFSSSSSYFFSSAPSSTRSRILAAVDTAARYVRSLVHRGESSTTALVLVPSQPHPAVDDVDQRVSSRSTKAPPKRTRSKPKGPAVTCRSAAVVHALKDAETGDGGEKMVRWDRLFQDLNPN